MTAHSAMLEWLFWGALSCIAFFFWQPGAAVLRKVLFVLREVLGTSCMVRNAMKRE